MLKRHTSLVELQPKYCNKSIKIFTNLLIYCFTCPLIATGRSKIPCIPKIDDCGGLIIGVPNKEPNTPPLLMVKVPPSMSSTAI